MIQWFRNLFSSHLVISDPPMWSVTTTEYHQCVSLRGDGEILSYQRHLYLGAEFCKRGCGHRNPKYKAEASA